MAAAREGNGSVEELDAVVVGAGFAGLYMLHRLRQLGLSATVLESADDVGGTWYWNRYPGARCDIPTTDYTYSFDPELEAEWTWSEKYAAQPEILSYLQYVAKRYDLRPHIRFSTRVASAAWDDAASRWTIRTEEGDRLSCHWYIMATGCLSLPKEPDIAGTDRFTGEVYYTSRWPHEGVDFSGKRVAVIGTGSSGIQSIPLIAEQASQLFVFQRTPNFSLPAFNGPAPEDRLALLAEDRDAYREAAKHSMAGVSTAVPLETVGMLSEEERRRRFEEAWGEGHLLAFAARFADVLTNREANDAIAEMVREKIREVVDDPDTAESLCPTTYPIMTKRMCLDTGYYAAFNKPHVRLVDLRKHPITTITEKGIDTIDEFFEIDAVVYATGFDAMTGALVSVDVTGRHGLTLKRKWAHGPHTYLGLMTVGFPNLFMITGPGSPSVLSNMSVSIEQHVEWVADCLEHLREQGFERIEPTHTAETGWDQHVHDCADITLFPVANSWYMGANVPGKPRVFLPYVGGVDVYRATCEEVVERGYLGFQLSGPAGTQCNDGVIRRVQPDVFAVLNAMAELDLPLLETLSPAEARALTTELNAARPPGPEVGEIVDGELPGPTGHLEYRLYRPPTAPGPHPIVVYFHGGGWVLGDKQSDEPLCRELCVRADAVVVSVDYRHAPEHRFPAAADDAFAAVTWVAAHVQELGGIPGELAVAGWSAGGNLAAVACQRARDAGGPDLVGQVLLTPLTDYDMTRSSYVENADGYILTAGLMKWFWDHYADPAVRADPRVSPLRAADLSALPPALVVTCEFDPLRDEGIAYAKALEADGVPVRLITARGHTHTSPTMVGVVLSGASIRAEMAGALRQFFAAAVPA
jgi:cation diffusion facilitator CzcD-associated flavoprotein CzcO/acetyl esterase/lipase